MPTVAYIVTSSTSLNALLRGEPAWMAGNGFDVAVITGSDGVTPRRDRGVALHIVPLRRQISLVRDAVALARIWRLLRKIRPEIVNAGTVKAGLLGIIAAFLAGVPIRIYTLRGLRLETLVGAKRALLWTTERIACFLSTLVVCVSPSLRRRAIDLRLVDDFRSVVLNRGSSGGVDVSEFAPTPTRRTRAQAIRAALGIPAAAPVLGFVGRLARDKGIAELVDAFSAVVVTLPDTRLLLVGAEDPGDPLPEVTRRRIEGCPNIIRTGWLANTSDYFHVLDVLVLPSYREGFPNVVLQAAAAEKPSVGTTATGTVDAVVDGITGLLVPPRDPQALAGAVLKMLADAELARRMGRAARQFVEANFQSERIWAGRLALYRQLLAKRRVSGTAADECSPAEGRHNGQCY